MLLLFMFERSIFCFPDRISQLCGIFSKVFGVRLSPFSPESDDEGLQESCNR